MSEHKISSSELLKGVLDPHTMIALDLIGMVRALSTGDPSYRFQVASIIVFLAGVDKALNLALGLLYLAGKVDWNWMVPNTRWKPQAGFIECQRGLTSKIMKLEELGVNVNYLQGIIDLRNEFVHSCNIYMGYRLSMDATGHEIQLKPSGPDISFPLCPMTTFRSDEIRYYADRLVNEIGAFIDSLKWQSKWFTLTQKIKHLPLNPEPEYAQLKEGINNEIEIVDALNQRLVGDGAQLLRK